jgi:cell division protein ZapA (FtsZ GTPase activity inhibitor)
LKQIFNIDILGQPFSFKTDSDASDASAAAEYVVKSVDQARKQCVQKTAAPDKWAILVLAALNIANDYIELQKKHQNLLQVIDQRSAHLLQTLESQLV